MKDYSQYSTDLKSFNSEHKIKGRFLELHFFFESILEHIKSIVCVHVCVACAWMCTCLCVTYMVNVWILQLFSILYVGESYFIWTQSLKIKPESLSLTCGIKGGPLVLSSIRALMVCRIWALDSSNMLASGCIWPVLAIMEKVYYLLIHISLAPTLLLNDYLFASCCYFTQAIRT